MIKENSQLTIKKKVTILQKLAKFWLEFTGEWKQETKICEDNGYVSGCYQDIAVGLANKLAGVTELCIATARLLPAPALAALKPLQDSPCAAATCQFSTLSEKALAPLKRLLLSKRTETGDHYTPSHICWC